MGDQGFSLEGQVVHALPGAKKTASRFPVVTHVIGRPIKEVAVAEAIETHWKTRPGAFTARFLETCYQRNQANPYFWARL